MGLFGDFDVEDIAANPYEAPVGTWEGVITKVTTPPKKEDGLTYAVFEITEKDSTRSLGNVFCIAGLDPAMQKVRLGYLKQFLEALEFPVSRMNSATIEDYEREFLNVDVILTTKKNTSKGKEYVNIESSNGHLSLRRKGKVSIGEKQTAYASTGSIDPFKGL